MYRILVIIGYCLMFFGLFCMLLTIGMINDEVDCVREHYPEKFNEISVQIIEDIADLEPSDNIRLDCKYVFNNVEYEDTVGSKHYLANEKFFVCSEDPTEIFSETDIENNLGTAFPIVMKMIFIGLSFLFIIPGILCYVVGAVIHKQRKLIKKNNKNDEYKINLYNQF